MASEWSGTGKLRTAVLVALAVLAVLVGILLQGKDVALLNPKGWIAREQAGLMIFSTGFMLAIAIPTLGLLYYFAWKYRESNRAAVHQPQRKHSPFFWVGLWSIPIIAVITLTSVVWPATRRLDPRRTVAAEADPLTIQVVALRWKWLFIYPEQQIATVNYVQVPTDTPLKFELTADEAPMSSFWIPHLGGQLYAMTGHRNQLNLLADTPGSYRGRTAEINGAGFSGMTFTVQATRPDDFETWTQQMPKTSPPLDRAAYQSLLVPSQQNPRAFYRLDNPDLYASILAKYQSASKPLDDSPNSTSGGHH